MKRLLLLPLTFVMSQAFAGTLFFQGALVEPTCLAEVVGSATRAPGGSASLAGSGEMALHLSECRASAAMQADSSAMLSAQAPVAVRHVVSPVNLMELSTPVSALVGRASVDTVTVSYI